MSDGQTPQDGTPHGTAAGEDAIGRLVRGAGPRPDVPAERAHRVREAVHASWRRSVLARKRARWIAWSAAPLVAAAAWVILVASGVWEKTRTTLPSPPIATLEKSAGSVVWSGRLLHSPGSALDAGTTLDTGTDGRVALRQSGGASVRFDVESRARLLSATEVLLDRGTAYVDTGSARGVAPPVTIRTPLGSVRDIGTQFEVRVSNDAVRLSVREGVASLEHRGLSHDAPSGIRLTVGADGKVTQRSVPPSGPEWDWTQEAAPPFDLEGRLLGEYLDWIGRETGLQVGYADPSISRDRSAVILHGSVQGLRPDETLAAVLPTCGLRHRVEGGRLIIERADGEGRHE